MQTSSYDEICAYARALAEGNNFSVAGLRFLLFSRMRWVDEMDHLSVNPLQTIELNTGF